MSTGLQGQKIMSTTSFVGKVCRKNPGFNVWADSAWPFIFHFPLCTSQGIKVPFENKVTGLAHWRSLVSPCFSFFLSFFLSLTLFFRLIPWSTVASAFEEARASFNLLFSYLQHSFIISLPKSFSSPMLFLLRVPLDPAGAGPQQGKIYLDLSINSSPFIISLVKKKENLH